MRGGLYIVWFAGQENVEVAVLAQDLKSVVSRSLQTESRAELHGCLKLPGARACRSHCLLQEISSKPDLLVLSLQLLGFPYHLPKSVGVYYAASPFSIHLVSAQLKRVPPREAVCQLPAFGATQ
jgi:hypothetical protein